MSKLKFQMSNQIQNQNVKKNCFGITSFELDLKFVICHLDL